MALAKIKRSVSLPSVRKIKTKIKRTNSFRKSKKIINSNDDNSIDTIQEDSNLQEDSDMQNGNMAEPNISSKVNITNPINFKQYSKKYWEIKAKTDTFPANQLKYKQRLRYLLDNYNLIILTAETGAGKSTQIPKQVWEYFQYSGMVVCTQPTQLNASAIAKRVADELDVEYGNEVQSYYQGSLLAGSAKVGGLDKLRFITDGSLVNDLMKDPRILIHYDALIVDEAHIRNTNIDLLLYFMKLALMEVPNLTTKLIIMSATADTKLFLKYFKDFEPIHHHIEGRTFPVSVYWSPYNIYDNKSADLNVEMFKAIKKIITKIFNKDGGKPLGDILVFLPTIAHIKQCKLELEYLMNKLRAKSYRILEVYSEMLKYVGDEGEKLVTEPILATTKIVLATNVAETGITINGLYYVIDSGLAMTASFDMNTREYYLDTGFISQAEAQQRKGRVGRAKQGICYRLYTEAEFVSFRKMRKVAMETENLDKFILMLLKFNNYKPKGGVYTTLQLIWQLITPPEKSGIMKTLDRFKDLKLLRKIDKSVILSQLGECVAAFDFGTVDLAIFFLTGFAYDIPLPILCDFVAILSIEQLIGKWFKTVNDKTIDPIYSEFIEHYKNEYGDIFGLYRIYLDLRSKIPKAFMKYIEIDKFNKIADISGKLEQHPAITATFLCQDISAKYKVSEDIFEKLTATFRQVYGETQNIDLVEKTIFFKYTGKSAIYLNKINFTEFGKKLRTQYDNFIKY